MMNTIPITARRNRILTGCVGLLALLFLFSFLGSQPLLHFPGLQQVNALLFFISRLLYWLCMGVLWLYARNVEKQDLLLYKEAPYPFATYIAFVAILMLILFAGSLVLGLLLKLVNLNQSSQRMAELMHIFRQYPLLLVFTSLTAGVTEEIMFRGYLQTRIEALFGKPYLSILISSLLFGLLHFRYGTIANMLIPFYIGFVFAYCYHKYRNIKVLMICHFLWDVAAGLVYLNLKHS